MHSQMPEVCLCRCCIFPVQLSRLLVFRKSRVASFQGRVACRFYPLKGLLYSLTLEQALVKINFFVFYVLM